MSNPRCNIPRLLLSKVRNGDFAHPGEIEAIDLVLTKLNELTKHTYKSNILDVGCGFGGTAEYIKKN